MRDLFVIVRRGSTYFISTINHHSDGSLEDPLYTIYFPYHEKGVDPEATKRDLTPSNLFKFGSPHFLSWEAAASYFLWQFQAHQVWFHVESVGDQQWWQHHRARVSCKCEERPYQLKPPYRGQIFTTIEELDVWLLMPGVERTWYTSAILEEEGKKRLSLMEKKLNYSRKDYLDGIIQDSSLAWLLLGDHISHLSEVTRTIETGKEQLKRTTSALTQEIQQTTDRIRRELNLIEIMERQRGSYETCVVELEAHIRQIMRELAEAPVEDQSGLLQAIPTELPSAEVEARIANELKQIKKFHARVRTAEGEATIATLPPAGGISQQELLALIDEIKQRNLQAGYLRLRSEVETEIASGQQRPHDEPPPPQSPPPYPPSSAAPMQRRKKVI